MGSTFIVPGRPRPKERPRMGRHGVYTPARTREYEELVGWHAKAAGLLPVDGPVRVEISLYFCDKRWPDLDNCAKAVLDGLEGIAYSNDRQVVEQTVRIRVDADQRAEVSVVEVAG